MYCTQVPVLNDLLRTALSCGRMIWFLPLPSPPISRKQVVSLSQSSGVSPVEITDGREGGGGGRGAKSRLRESWSSINLQYSLNRFAGPPITAAFNTK